MQPYGLAGLLFSSYSPYALHDLPQPTPSDLPPGCDSRVFGFQDAFEDLLAMSNGQPLPNIHQRYKQKLALREMFPSGEPVGYWHSRLAAAGLLSGYRAPRNLDEFTKADFEALHDELRSKANEVWGRRMRRQAIQEMIENDTHGGPLRDNKASMATNLLLKQKKLDEARDTPDHKGGTESARQGTTDPVRKRIADTETELFEAFQNLAESGQRTWDAFARSFVKPLPHIIESMLGLDHKNGDDVSRVDTKIGEEFAKAERAFRDIVRHLEQTSHTEQKKHADAVMPASLDESGAPQPGQQPSEVARADGRSTGERKIRVEESKDEHRDEYGYIHSKVIRKEIDEDGVEVGRSETYTMYPAPDRMASPGDESETSHKNGHKAGWFWR